MLNGGLVLSAPLHTPVIHAGNILNNLLRVNNCWHGLLASVWKNVCLNWHYTQPGCVKNCLTTFLVLSHTPFPYVPKERSNSTNCTLEWRMTTSSSPSVGQFDMVVVLSSPTSSHRPPLVTHGLTRRPHQSWELCIQICKTFVLVFYLPVNKIIIWTIDVLLQLSGICGS